jgi:hypothetical protein
VQTSSDRFALWKLEHSCVVSAHVCTAWRSSISSNSNYTSQLLPTAQMAAEASYFTSILIGFLVVGLIMGLAGPTGKHQYKLDFVQREFLSSSGSEQ